MFDCSLVPSHIRSTDAEIFRACHEWDLPKVRFLLEAGLASVHDIDHENRNGLLEVRHQNIAEATITNIYTETEKKIAYDENRLLAP
jgi:hypothetical protein